MVAPLRAEVHRDFGDRLAAANRPREALVEYQALLAMNPQDLADAHYRLAKTYVAARRPSQGPRTFTVCSGNRPALSGSPTAAIGGRTLSDADNKLETQETRALIENFQTAFGQIRTEVRKIIVGPGRRRRASADDAARRRPLLDHGHAGHGQDAARAHARERARPHVQAHPVHARPDADRRHGHRHPRGGHVARAAAPGRSCRARCSRTCCSPTRSTARRRRRSPRCSRRCRSSRSRCAATITRSTRPFFVLATQNPIELEGTYPLPEAQLDRFLFNVLLDYLSAEDEVDVVHAQHDAHGPARDQCVHDAGADPEVPMARAPSARVADRQPLRRRSRARDAAPRSERARDGEEIRAVRRQRPRDACSSRSRRRRAR